MFIVFIPVALLDKTGSSKNSLELTELFSRNNVGLGFDLSGCQPGSVILADIR